MFGDVTSANVVGYQTQNLVSGKGKFQMVNVPFNHVNDKKGFDIENDLDLQGKHGDADWNTANSDQIWVWDVTVGGGIGGYNKFYWDVGCDDPSEGWDPGWTEVLGQMTMFNEIYPDGIPEGSSFFFVNSEAVQKAMTVSGAVESRDEVEIPCATGKGKFAMVGNPFPVVTDIEDEDQVLIANKHGDSDWNTANSDQIWVWDVTVGGGIGGYNKFYWDVGCDDPSEGWDPGWTEVLGQMTMFNEIYPDGIPAGTPFYFINSQAVEKSVTFTSPLAK